MKVRKHGEEIHARCSQERSTLKLIALSATKIHLPLCFQYLLNYNSVWKFMKPVLVCGKHCSTTYSCQLACLWNTKPCMWCLLRVSLVCSPRLHYSSVTKDNVQTVNGEKYLVCLHCIHPGDEKKKTNHSSIPSLKITQVGWLNRQCRLSVHCMRDWVGKPES